ncbi:hypothetical protein DDF62_08675 [Caulobacter radicis]|uniref:UvrD-helicase domain-containing protein n=1 Tax=Caulobacter radicis TaxID=2172650 RepID=UPI000D5814FC|nr:UvrD-helicase domain-containing protein [Caulobacter radicis]PVM90870.1 hypothetical protein DDF62_08675 [Caulobacter radicis]
MLEIAPITPELLAALGEELGGCDFGHASHADFLGCVTTCDVQAAPGNGKTTLLAAKLALLSRSWVDRRQGVCVITHTNAARSEVEDLIAGHASAARLMAYPHFTGTVTAFVNQYLALPYLRGLGWPIRQIDDDAFEAEALRFYASWQALDWHANKSQRPAKATVEAWVSGLELASDFVSVGPAPQSLAVRRIKGQHGADTACGKALAQLKAAMVRRGLYRYGDMTALAWRALETTPGLADRLRARFPLVILDEAQDTNGRQMQLLEHLFRDRGAFQRLGDSNQTLYEDAALGASDYWTPGAASIPLDASRRFGGEIASFASFASRLTARKAQTIVGDPTRASRRVLLVFDQASIGGVIGAFAGEARAHYGQAAPAKTLWAVASRHNIPGRGKGPWSVKSLVDYHPAYRAEGSARLTADRFCRQMQKAALHHAARRAPAEVGRMLAAAMATLCGLYGLKAAGDKVVTAHTVWTTLASRDLDLPRKVRRLLRDQVLAGNAPWSQDDWELFVQALMGLLGPADAAVQTHCAYVSGQQLDDPQALPATKKEVRFEDLTVRLGSIHSVKGKTVDGILVVESQIWRSPATKDQCMDLETVLPHAFNLTNEVFDGVALTAATNVFVAVTRPRELLGLAIRAEVATQALRTAALAQGWKLVDLSTQPASPSTL